MQLEVPNVTPSSAAIPRLRFSALSVCAAAIYVLALGIPTAVIPSPFFDRILPVNAWNLASLLIPALLFGPLAATYLVPWPTACRIGGRAGVGGVLSWLAVGCPLCNKLVVLAVGVSGATDYVRPLQPVLGAGSALLLALALRARFANRARPEPAPVQLPASL